MIDINLYRCRIGCYDRHRKAGMKRGRSYSRPQAPLNQSGFAGESVFFLLYSIFIIYANFVLFLMLKDCNSNHNIKYNIQEVKYEVNNSILCYANPLNKLLKLAFVVIYTFLLTRSSLNQHRIRRNSLNPLSYCCKLYIGNTMHKKKRFLKILAGMQYWLSMISLLLVVMSNPSILNPGPESHTNSTNPTSCNYMSIFYQNVQGLIPFSNLPDKNPNLDFNKLLELQGNIYSNKYDVVVLNETWLKSSIHNNEILSDTSYKIFRLDRSVKTHPPDASDPKKFRKNGGGVLIAIKSNLDVISKQVNLKPEAELLSVELTLSNKRKIVICTCYRVGTLGTSNHSKIKQHIEALAKRKNVAQIIIVGDFNLKSIDWSEPASSIIPIEQNFIDTFSDLGLQQLVFTSTHCKGGILDLVLTNKPQAIQSVNILDSDGGCKSDHFPIILHTKFNVKRMKSTKRKIYNFKKANWPRLNEDINNTDWNALLANCDIETAWGRFKHTLSSLINIHIPTITIKSEFQPPWFDSEAFALCREKERWRSKFKRTKNDEHYMKFSKLRKDFRKLVQKKMQSNLQDDSADAISKKFWSHVKSTTNSHRIPECINFNSRFRSNPQDQADLFNDYFYQQFSEPSSYQTHIDFTNDHIFYIDFNYSRICQLLLKIDPNKAQGPDNINGRVLKNCAKSLCIPLTYLFRLSYSTSCIPQDWKMANIVPVHKKGSKSNVENYRPISLTSLVMKIFEKVIREELMAKCSSLIDDRQHGFLPMKSCTTQMVPYVDSLMLSLNNNFRTDTIYFDFAKAFDSVSHDIILDKLKYSYNIDGTMLKFLKCYLQDRKQSVVIGNTTSNILNVNSGVPQGSILGPLLFVLFINDIFLGLSPGTNIALYADDTKIWRTIQEENDHLILQKDIRYLENWASINKMKFHPQKCKALSTCLSQPPLLDILPEIQYFYKMGDTIIDYTDTEKDLGVHVNAKLNWNNHCELLYSKASMLLGLVKRSCNFTQNQSQRRSLYLAIIRGQFEHCSVIWRPTTKTMSNKLESIQKRAIKWILFEYYASYSPEIYLIKCKHLNILPISYHFDVNDLTLFHRIIYKLTPIELPNYLSFFESTRLRNSHFDSLSLISSLSPKVNVNPGAHRNGRNYRNSDSINITSSRLVTNSFFYRTHLLWNRLPLEIRQTESPSIFKTSLVQHMWHVASEALIDSDCDTDYESDYNND